MRVAMAMRRVLLAVLSAERLTTPSHVLSVVAVPAVSDAINEVELDLVGSDLGPQELQKRKGQERVHKQHLVRDNEDPEPPTPMRAARLTAESTARCARVGVDGNTSTASLQNGKR